MFKSLIATCLLTFSCSTKSLKIEKTKEANYIGTSLVLRSAYTFNDVFDYDTFYSYNIEEDIEIDLRGALDSQLIYFVGILNGNNLEVFELDHLIISYEYEEDKFSISFIEYDGNYWITDRPFTKNDVYNVELMALWVYDDVFSYFIQNLVFSFPQEQYLTGNQIPLFNLFFSQNGNRYVQYYNGFYNFNNGNWHNTINYQIYYPFGAFYTAQSYIFNGFKANNTEVTFSTYYSDLSTQSYVKVYDNGAYNKIGNFYIQGLMPQAVRNYLSTVGQFQYIDQTQDTTWYEMLLAVMDAPIYYLKNLFGFELFGLNLFVAFSSLLTLCLIVVIIKKVV